MRLLTHAGFFSTEINNTDNNETMYSLTSLSRILVNDNSATASFSPFLQMILDPVIMNPFQSTATWFRGDTLTPFEEAHGCTFWEKANLSPQFNNLFNAAMASDSSFTQDVLVKQCGVTLFGGMSSLVDVGGGTGTIARAISDAFPDVKCSVLELAHVVEEAPMDGRVEFIAGDMFLHIPPADAVLLKLILHDWDDEDCVKILRRCKEAIPARGEGGKVIIIDIVMNSHPKSMETQLCWDMFMMVVCKSAERREDEWRKIFADAGFSDYKITPALGLRSIIELYP